VRYRNFLHRGAKLARSNIEVVAVDEIHQGEENEKSNSDKGEPVYRI
jgi:hypothetical protein